MQVYKEPTHRLKLSIFGDSGVGKTSLVRSLQNRELENYEMATVGAEFTCNYFNIDDHRVRVETWDTAGQERYRSLASMYYREVTIYMLCYDCSIQRSKESVVSYWLPDILKSNYYDPKHCLIVLMGCKSDIRGSTQLSTAEYEQCVDLVESKDGQLMHMSSTSTKNGEVQEIFKTLCRSAIEHNCRFDTLRRTCTQQVKKSRWSCLPWVSRKSKPRYATSNTSLLDSLL